MPSLSWALSLLVILICFLVFTFTTIVLILASMSVLVLGTTWVYSLFSGQTYDRVCDNSEIVYQLNNIGKWVSVITIGIGIAYLIWK